MITTIIITALVSVIGTLVIGYFIWQFVRVRKLKKQVKDNKKGILGNAEWIKNVEDNGFNGREEIHKRVDEEVHEIQKQQNEIYDNMSKVADHSQSERNEIYNNMGKESEKLWNYINKYDEDIHRELDKRFDKIYQQIKEFSSGKFIQDKFDDK